MIEMFNYNKTQKDLEIAVKRIKDARTNLAFAREMWIKDISMRTNFLRLLILKRRKELEEYRVQNRGGRGVITYKVTPKTGDIVGIRIATDEEDVMLITDNGTIIRLNVKDISILGRATQGVTLMRTNEGKVVSIEKISLEESE